MKRYTVVLKPEPETDTAPMRVRDVVASCLLASRAPVGQVERVRAGESGALRVEISSSSQRAPLLEAFAACPGFALERVEWGWAPGGEGEAPLPTRLEVSHQKDPLAGPAASLTQEVFQFGARGRLRLVALMVLFAWAIFTIYVRLVMPGTALYVFVEHWRLVISLIILVQVIALAGLEGQLTALKEVSSIYVGENRVRVRTWPWGSFETDYSHLTGLDVRMGRLTLWAGGKGFSFPLSGGLSSGRSRAALRALVTRSGLRFVEGAANYASYRKP